MPILSDPECWTRRDFLKVAGAAGLFAGFPNFARGAELLNADIVKISILHTTDLHGNILPTIDYDERSNLGGMARCITQIRQWQVENPNNILLDVGDVYQGTDFALRDRGQMMIDLFNLMRYDAWIVRNHEFDWGIEPFLRVVERSSMPVLAANTLLEGSPAGEFKDAKNPLAKIQPYILREIAGIKIAIIGVTTPGMPFWFRPEFTRGIEFQFPVKSVRHAIARAKAERANAIVFAGHMGLKERTGGDDFANTVMALTSEFPEATVFIAGHTHRHIASRLTNGALLTQADHFGIHVGRVDLLFDRDSKKLLHQVARCELMDHRFELDPMILSRAKSQLDESAAALAQPIGELAETLSVRTHPGEPSDVEKLIAAAIMETLSNRGTRADGVMHGLFEEKHSFKTGVKTVGDIWEVLPYENFLVTAELTPSEIKIVMEEVFQSHGGRNLMGFEITTAGRGSERRITAMTLSGRQPLDPGKRYRIAFNNFDSRSAGHRFMKLRDLLETASANCILHPVQTREALIDYFRRHKIVHRIRSTPGLPLAA